jgi:uncharacterized membrane protein YcaP (DUF421 family)
MDGVIRAVFIYFFLLLLFNITPKRAISSLDTFDFVLLLIISEAAQNALVGENYSITHSVLIISTLVGLTIMMGWMKQRYNWFEKLLSGTPLLILENGKTFQDRMKRNQVDDTDILSAARDLQGIERLDQIKYAVLETNGSITIIPASGPGNKAA